ncbi:DUF4837 family protein [Flavobacterium granuli]|uniref:Beta-lactamase enzyme family protein n=1 Tax=Flavobacterium granuli TaxID=280093 RepID=A0ABU1S268_9FLAO|nr:DUF4837 family protein [Flavobacterium granuli]MDR6845146.1 hypothetical protein [Flavobacterium granuli]
MNKTVFLFLLTIGILFSCSKKKENSSRQSSGKINAISIVIDNQLWNGVVGDSIRNKFASPVEGLPKEEPIFDINQYPTDVMEGFVTKSRTIIVIKLGIENRFVVQKNQYATPQNVFHITGKSVAALLKLIEKHTPYIIQSIKKAEIAAHWELLKDSVITSKIIHEQFQLDLKVPKSYSFSIKNNNFVWLKREFSSGSTSILLAQFPINSFNLEENVLSQIVKIQDSIGAVYVKGEEPSSKMYIDTSYPIYLLETSLDGKRTYETRGTWRLKDSFMFGAFVSYLIVDTQKNRITYLVGFCYVPSKDRRDFMHELETILKEVRIN